VFDRRRSSAEGENETETTKSFNRAAAMGFVIVPSQPFGYNYLGGKLLASICCSHEVREF